MQTEKQGKSERDIGAYVILPNARHLEGNNNYIGQMLTIKCATGKVLMKDEYIG